MSEQPADSGQVIRGAERVVYVIPPEAIVPTVDREVDVALVLRRLWRGRAWIFGATLFAIAVAGTYLLITPPWYRAEVVLMSAEGRSIPALPESLAGLSGLAGLAGISIGGGGTAEPRAVLTSDDFTRDFIVKHRLKPVLFADKWDAARGTWKSPDASRWPDDHDAVKLIDERVRRVSEDKRSGEVRLTVDWTDPVIAAEWANAMVDDLNERMRQRALQEAESNLAYLQREMDATSLVTLQQSIGRLIEGEIQKAMLAKGEREFSFRVIDRAEPPKWRAGPRRALVLALSTLAGMALGVVLIQLRGVLARPVDAHRNGTHDGAPGTA